MQRRVYFSGKGHQGPKGQDASWKKNNLVLLDDGWTIPCAKRGFFLWKMPQEKWKKNYWFVARWQDAGEGPALWLYWSWPLGSCCLPPPAWQKGGGGDTQHVAKQPPSQTMTISFWNVNLFATILIKGGQIVSGPRWRWVRRQFSLLQRPPFILWHFLLQLEDLRYFG